MTRFTQRLQQTTPRKILLLPRLLAGVPLVVFSSRHFLTALRLRDTLSAAGGLRVEGNVLAASSAGMLGGVLLLTGFFARIGGLLGVGTMVPAILTTVRLASLPDAPTVPPVPL